LHWLGPIWEEIWEDWYEGYTNFFIHDRSRRLTSIIGHFTILPLFCGGGRERCCGGVVIGVAVVAWVVLQGWCGEWDGTGVAGVAGVVRGTGMAPVLWFSERGMAPVVPCFQRGDTGYDTCVMVIFFFLCSSLFCAGGRGGVDWSRRSWRLPEELWVCRWNWTAGCALFAGRASCWWHPWCLRHIFRKKSVGCETCMHFTFVSSVAPVLKSTTLVIFQYLSSVVLNISWWLVQHWRVMLF